MQRSDTTSGKDGICSVRDLGNGRLALRLSEMRWETEFFGRRFGRLEIDGEGTEILLRNLIKSQQTLNKVERVFYRRRENALSAW